jgi:hypothetical protein
MCNRLLDQKDDPLSVDCGGDCWGCIGEIEAEAGYEPSAIKYESELSSGLRLRNGTVGVAVSNAVSVTKN